MAIITLQMDVFQPVRAVAIDLATCSSPVCTGTSSLKVPGLYAVQNRRLAFFSMALWNHSTANVELSC